MRIIAGTHRRRQLVTPAGHSTRPMPDRLRETLFDILNKRVLNRVFVDLYAGSGAVGFEALSRGARKVIFVENSHAAIQALWKNISALGVQDTCSVFASPTEKVLPSIDGEIYFIGAPYIFPNEYKKSLSALETRSFELVIVQHNKKYNLAQHCKNFEEKRVISQGSNRITFLEPQSKVCNYND